MNRRCGFKWDRKHIKQLNFEKFLKNFPCKTVEMEAREKRWHSGSFEMEEIEFKNVYQSHSLILLSKGKKKWSHGRQWSELKQDWKYRQRDSLKQLLCDCYWQPRRDEWEGFWAAESIQVRFQNDLIGGISCWYSVIGLIACWPNI